jgi:hypothetical protein
VDILDRRDGADGVDVGDLVDREGPPVVAPYKGYIEPIVKFDSGFLRFSGLLLGMTCTVNSSPI